MNCKRMSLMTHTMGFVEGVRYALNIMDMTDTGKNKELLERLLNILEK